MMDERERNKLNRMLTYIEANAKKATPGPWDISHSHVIKHDKRNGKLVAYDIACRPWERAQAVYGINPYASPSASDDMRHITTCHPKAMLELVALVRKLLEESST